MCQLSSGDATGVSIKYTIYQLSNENEKMIKIMSASTCVEAVLYLLVTSLLRCLPEQMSRQLASCLPV